MILLRDLGIPIRGNACRLLHRLGIASADGRALRSCCTGRWRILRTARLLRPRTSSCGIAGGCGMRIWLFSCYTVLCCCVAQTDFLPYRIVEKQAKPDDLLLAARLPCLEPAQRCCAAASFLYVQTASDLFLHCRQAVPGFGVWQT